MKKLWKNNKETLFLIALALTAWRGILSFAESLGKYFVAERQNFLGPIPWANFDGVYYLTIAQVGYGNNYQAFFPLFPLLIGATSIFFGGNYVASSLFVVYTSLIIVLILLWKLVFLDYDFSVAKWSLLFFLFFPTSFFFGGVYTESLFLALVLGSFYAARKQKWFLAGLLGSLASMTRVVGVVMLPALFWEWWEQNKHRLRFGKLKLKVNDKSFFWLLLIPAGLFSYMFYQYIRFHDALAFVHIQPGFGANRTGGEIILLPQVFFRYLKIFATVSWSTYDVRIALLEVISFFFAIALLFFAWRKVRSSYILFSLFAVIVPTLTGTLSSMPRYILVVFPLFIMLALIKSAKVKIALLCVSISCMIILASLFLRGYWVG